MQIRITESFLEGTMQFIQGQVLDFPEPVATELIEGGKAIEVPKEERAALNYRPTIAGFAPPPRQKATRR